MRQTGDSRVLVISICWPSPAFAFGSERMSGGNMDVSALNQQEVICGFTAKENPAFVFHDLTAKENPAFVFG